MTRIQSRLALALIFTALTLLTFLGTTLASGPIGFLYGRTPGFNVASNVTQMAVLLAAACLFVAALIVAIPIALQSGSWSRKLLYVIPAYLLGVTLVGAIFSLLGVGTVGTIFGEMGMGITFNIAWLGVGAVLSTVAVVIAVARVKLSGSTLRSAMVMMGIAGVPGLIACLGIVASVAIVSTNQPTFPNFGGANGPPGAQGAQRTPGAQGGQGIPGAAAAQTGQGGQAGGGQSGRGTQRTPGAQGGQGAPGAPAGQGQQGGQPGQGGPGGPGGGIANAVRQFQIGGGLMALFAVIALISIAGGLLALRDLAGGAEGSTQVAPGMPANYRREAGRAITGGLAITFVALVTIQLVPVSRTNPPVQTPVQWDSQQTRELADRACMNCHSNETKWPWYSSVAPVSWLNTIHVNNARQGFNLSELNKVPAFMRSQLPNNMAQRIRNGTMPPSDYLMIHPEARLSDTEKQELIQGLQKSLGSSASR